MGIFNDNSQNNNTGGSGQPGLPGQKGDPGIGFKLTADGNFDLDNKQIKNLSGGTDKSDAVNYGQLLEHTENHQNDYHLQPSFTLYKNFGDGAILKKANSITIDPNHKHLGLTYVKKQGSDSGFGGQAWVSLKMTNNLPVGIYTVVFELFSGISGISGSVTQLNNETLLQQVHGDDNYKFIIFSHDYQTTHSKAFIQFTSNGQAGGITFQIRYYGSSYNNPTLNFLFFSRVLAGRVGTAFNHNLFDVDDVQLVNQILYFDDVNLNENKIKSLGAPTEDEDGANKKYVDDEIAKLPHSDNGTLKLDGSRAMVGNLDMGHHTITGIKSSSADNAALTVGGAKATYLPLSGNRAMRGTLDMGSNAIKNIKGFVEDDSTQASIDAQFYDVVHWGKIHEIRATIERNMNAVAYQALNRNDPDPMEDPINMGNHFITNIKDPQVSDNTYAATVNFVNKTVSDNNTTISTLIESKINEIENLNIKAAKQENVFSFVMDDDMFKEDDSDITKIGKVNKDFYDIRKETYQFDINYDSNIGYYSTRTGIDLKPIDLGEYTLVFEMYFNETKIDKNEVIVNAVSTPLNISRRSTNQFSNHSRTIINFHKYSNIGIIDLDIDITIKNKGGISYDPTTTIYVIVYGVEGHQNDVDPRIWDRVYYIENNTIKFEAPIDMVNKEIINVADGVADSDAINLKQLKAEIDKVKTDDTNDHALSLALYNYIMKNGTKVGILKDLYFTDSRETKTSNSYLSNFNKHLDSSNRNNFTFYYVFKHNTTSGSGNEMRIAMQWGKTDKFPHISKSFIHLFIHVTSSRIIISISPFVSPSLISSINIPNNALGKQIWFWIWTQGTTFHLITSGNNTITHNLRNLGLDADHQFIKFNVDDSPFPKIRGLITSNVYDNNSEANRKVREFEIAQGTIL